MLDAVDGKQRNKVVAFEPVILNEERDVSMPLNLLVEGTHRLEVLLVTILKHD